MELAISIAIYALIGWAVGHYWRDIVERVKKLENKKPEPEIGITKGEYTKNMPVSNTGEIGISEPKTPQLVEWEAREALEKSNVHVEVKPR